MALDVDGCQIFQFVAWTDFELVGRGTGRFRQIVLGQKFLPGFLKFFGVQSGRIFNEFADAGAAAARFHKVERMGHLGEGQADFILVFQVHHGRRHSIERNKAVIFDRARQLRAVAG